MVACTESYSTSKSGLFPGFVLKIIAFPLTCKPVIHREFI